jgi:ABC-type branched-subunit amino acid transport system substrate-binding protein
MRSISLLMIAVIFFPLLAATAEPLKVGFVVPLTGSAALMGESLNGIVKLAGLRNISPQFEDDRCEAKTALSAYLKLRGRGVRVFYLACSGSILALAPHAKRNGDLILTSYAGSIKIRQTGSEVIRFNPDAVSIAEGMISLLTPELKPTIVLFEEQDYAQSLSDKLHETFGGTIIESISYRADAASFAAEALKIRQQRSAKSVIFISVSDSAARRMLRALAQVGVDVPILGEVNLCDYPFSLAEFGLRGECVSARFSGERFTTFMSEYKSQIGREPAYPFYDAIALDLLQHLDGIASNQQEPAKIGAKLLEGFPGRFAQYSLTKDGEVIDGGRYLVRVER